MRPTLSRRINMRLRFSSDDAQLASMRPTLSRRINHELRRGTPRKQGGASMRPTLSRRINVSISMRPSGALIRFNEADAFASDQPASSRRQCLAGSASMRPTLSRRINAETSRKTRRHRRASMRPTLSRRINAYAPLECGFLPRASMRPTLSRRINADAHESGCAAFGGFNEADAFASDQHTRGGFLRIQRQMLQ